jgi:putative ABC transport system permease protein
VVGIVANEHLNALDTPAIPEVYQSYRQSTEGPGARAIAVRASVTPGSIVPGVRAALASVDPEVPLSNIATMEQRIDEAGLARRFNTLLFGAFAAVALGLAGIGVYGVIAYSASQRRTEMGIRMALGATRADIFKLVIGQGVALAVVGTVLGIAGALAITHFLSSLLFAVRPTDPVTLTTSRRSCWRLPR